VAEADPAQVIDKRGFTLPASVLLPKTVALGMSIDQGTLAEGLELTQPLRHGRADDEWIQLGAKHLNALRELDEIDGLQVLHHVEVHPTVDDMMVTLFHEKAQTYAERDVRRVKDLLDVMEPKECDECWRRTFVPLGHDDSGGTMTVGSCIACGYQRTADTAWDMYMDEQWDLRWQNE